MNLLAGTSGYGFREWVGAFYPAKTKPADFLAYYASVFRSVEVNHTFRRFPKPELAASWAASTPESFRFAVKAHQGITHRARLADTEESVISFLRALEPLGDRLGPVLFQCPPWFRRDDDRLGTFLASLPAGGRYALEFRHDSWDCDPVREACRAAGAALVAGVSELEETPDISVTADFAYVRLRRDPPYSPAEQQVISGMLERLRDRVETLYLYVKHDGPGLAPEAVSWIQGLA
ncbi:MAG: DUF72 domain-containing protein [Acidobacteria bacterium]|nr:DUF72 domain-containing protein [Acidobacteriota bacterium]